MPQTLGLFLTPFSSYALFLRLFPSFPCWGCFDGLLWHEHGLSRVSFSFGADDLAIGAVFYMIKLQVRYTSDYIIATIVLYSDCYTRDYTMMLHTQHSNSTPTALTLCHRISCSACSPPSSTTTA